MTTVKSSASSTVITLLGTIGSSASMVAKTIDSASSSIDMLDRYVQRAKSNQIARHLVEDKDFLDNLINDAGEAKAMRLHNLEKKMQGNARLQQLFTEFVNEYRSLFTQTNP